ncbi:hypothetical protein EV646_11149 [Kribbella antiqua]|uniref:Phage derived Gp49-like protein DUF891 n=1 Tax=Kribbella antiqua TaxID=2512217 RepID=A0A4R2IHA4_9ACTN|nr:type II toxin-antitoxin system RelE/ParE family toxin [Kribbella antiqua]TCO43857.1 hypothetical protein EV646_11149 [Kribbella antiqua]
MEEYGIYVLDGCLEWMNSLPDKDFEGLSARLDLLAEHGPALPRPTVETIKGSRHPNMKELRYGKLRVLFAFDPSTRAVLLLGGSKQDRWTEWYEVHVPLADELFDEWLDNVKRNLHWADEPDS